MSDLEKMASTCAALLLAFALACGGGTSTSDTEFGTGGDASGGSGNGSSGNAASDQCWYKDPRWESGQFADIPGTDGDYGFYTANDDYIDVGGGTEFIGCGVKTSGELNCWNGRFGFDDGIPSGSVSAVAVGSSQACAIKNDGTLQCWPESKDELIGNTPSGSFSDVDFGNSNVCAIAEGGAVSCWGNDLTSPSERFVRVDVRDAVAVAESAAGVTRSGEIKYWGPDAEEYEDPPAGNSFIDVDIDTGRPCGLKDSGAVVCPGLERFAAERWEGCDFREINQYDTTYICGIRDDNGNVVCGRRDGTLVMRFSKSAPYKKIAEVRSQSGLCALSESGALECYGDEKMDPDS